MYELTIPAMSCDHCKGAITKATLALDPGATLHFDLTAHKASVETTQPLAGLEAALAAIGYPVAAARKAEAEARRCCGHCKA